MPKRESLTSSAYERLRADILTCRAAPGQRMNILEWAEKLEVSPGAVREALSRLTSEGLVHAEPQRGFRVAEVSLADLRHLTEARVAIEALVVQRSILQGDVAWESRVVAAHHSLSRTAEREAGDPKRLGDAWTRVHAEFHEAIVAACDNSYFLDLRRNLYAKSERYRRLSAPLARERRNVAAEHRALADAVLARDVERAASLLGQHIETTTGILERGLYPEAKIKTTTAKGSNPRLKARARSAG